ncbi:MAG: hypothetical protein AAF434_10835 [Pseudomonadota bacterium]
MVGLARYALAGTPQAAALVSGFLALGLIVPPLVLLSGALLSVVTLRKGTPAGTQAAALATVALGGLMIFVFSSVQAHLVLVLSFWLPSLVAASVLRSTIRLDLGLLVSGVFGVFGLLGIYIVFDDPAAIWLETLKVAMPAEVWTAQFQISETDYSTFLSELAEMMSAAMAASLVFSAIVSLLLARYWQAALFNPNGFQAEFHQLRMHKIVALGLLAIAGLSFVIDSQFLTGVMVVLLLVFWFQGIAVVHAIVKQRELGVGWLVVMYVLNVMVPQVVFTLATLGLADTWIDLRRRLSARSASDDI